MIYSMFILEVSVLFLTVITTLFVFNEVEGVEEYEYEKETD